MKQKLSFIALVGILFLSSCSREPVPYVPLIENASVEYEWSSGFDTYIDGYVYNDGETYIDAVELEIRTYDDFGYIIDYDWTYQFVGLYPGESAYFATSLPISWVSDVEVFVNRID